MYLSDRPRRVDGTASEQDAGQGTRRGTGYGTGRGAGRNAGPGARVGRTVILVGLVSLFTDISSESVSAVLGLYLTTVIGLGPLAYGFVDGVYQGVSALVRIIGGWAADRSNHPKRVALGGYLLSAVSRVALIPAHSFGAVTTVVGVDRLGKGLRTAPRDAIIAASAPPDALGRAFGVHRTLDTCGAVIGPFLAFAILSALPGDFSAVFVVSFAAAVVGLAILAFLVPDVRPRRDGPGVRPREDVPDRQPRPDRPASPASPFGALVRHGQFRRLVAITGLLGVLTVGDGFLYLALQDRADLAIRYFPLLYVGTNLAYMALALPLGRLADRTGRAAVFLGGHVALLAAYLCAGGPVEGSAVTIGCLVLLGTYYAATDGQLAALASRLFGGDSRGSAIATVQTAQAGARFASSLLFGALWAGLGQATAIRGVAVVLVLVLPVAWWLLRPVDHRASSTVPA
jgi:MFS family permease